MIIDDKVMNKFFIKNDEQESGEVDSTYLFNQRHFLRHN